MVEPRDYYDLKTMLAVAKSRGYPNFKSVAEVVGRMSGIKSREMFNKKLASGNFSFEESFVLAAFFQMTPKEYCDTFLHGLFRESREGHFVCYVEDPGRVLRAKKERGRQAREKAELRRRKREEIVKQIEELESEV